MRKVHSFIWTVVFLSLTIAVTHGQGGVSIIPQPNYLKEEKGSFTLPSNPVLLVPARNEAVQNLANIFCLTDEINFG